MTADFITDLMSLMKDCLYSRIEQVHLQVTHNQNAFPVYAKYSSEYHEARDKFAAEHPELLTPKKRRKPVRIKEKTMPSNPNKTEE